jgi:TM2 domain-containing membrane protein YozV
MYSKPTGCLSLDISIRFAVKVGTKMSTVLTRTFLKYFPLLVCLWVLLVLYPNPWRLAIGVKRILDPQTDPAAVASLAQDMPSDPTLIEDEVLKLIPYSYDWQTYGMPWYCPSVQEALQKGKGDCKARALVLASILQAKGIPNRIVWSLDHVWVDYPGKQNSSLEKNQLYEKNPETGKGSWSLPHMPPGDIFNELWTDFVRTMPGMRMFLLLGGLLALVGLRVAKTKRVPISPKSRLTTTLLALFLGAFGAHRFYVGKIKTGIVMLLLSITGVATAWIIIGIPFILTISAWVLVDLIYAATGMATDRQGRVISCWFPTRELVQDGSCRLGETT